MTTEIRLNPPAGLQDNWPYLQSQVSAAPPDTRFIFPEHEKIRCDGRLYFKQKHLTTVDGEGCTLYTDVEGDATRSHVTIDKCFGFRVNNLIVRGSNSNGWQPNTPYNDAHESQFGVYVRGSIGVVLDNVVAHHTWSDGIYVGMNTQDGTISRYVLIRDCLVFDTFRQGISVTGADNVVMQRPLVANIRRSCIDLEPAKALSGWQATNVWIEDGRFGPHKLTTVAANAPNLGNITICRSTAPHFSVIMGYEGARANNVWVECNKDAAASPDINMYKFRGVDNLVVAFNNAKVQDRGIPMVLTTDCQGVYGEGTNNYWPSQGPEFGYTHSTKGQGEAQPSPPIPGWALQ